MRNFHNIEFLRVYGGGTGHVSKMMVIPAHFAKKLEIGQGDILRCSLVDDALIVKKMQLEPGVVKALEPNLLKTLAGGKKKKPKAKEQTKK